MGNRFQTILAQKWLVFSLRGLKPVADTESLRRFLTVERWIDKKGNVKPQAFVPRDKERGTSVHRVFGEEDTLWRLGRLIAAGTRAGILYGQAEILAAACRSVALSFVRDWYPSRHVDLTGWPNDVVDVKSARMLLAEKLIAQPNAIRLIRPPD